MTAVKVRLDGKNPWEPGYLNNLSTCSQCVNINQISLIYCKNKIC